MELETPESPPRTPSGWPVGRATGRKVAETQVKKSGRQFSE